MTERTILESKQEQTLEAYLQLLPALTFPQCIDRAAYVVVPGKNLLISQEQAYNGLQFQDAREQVARQGLRMPRIDVWMTHYCNVRDAALGKAVLYDGNGNALTSSVRDALWERVSKKCDMWLDAVFEQDAGGHWSLETDFIIRRLQDDGGVTEQRSSRRVPVEIPFAKECYVDLMFNAQGMPLKKSEVQEYVRGSTLQFIPPVHKRVAWFGADSGGAYLSCDGNPTGSDSGLGVFACAEGAHTRVPRAWDQYEIELSDGHPDERYLGVSSLAGVLGDLEQSGRLTPEVRELILRRAEEDAR